VSTFDEAMKALEEEPVPVPQLVLPRGLVLETLQIGLMISAELGAGRSYWRRRDGQGCEMSFSLMLLHDVGGIQKFLAEWERVET